MNRITLLLVLVLLEGASSAGENWPQFRGPDGMGHSDASVLPLNWAEDKNVIWKTAIRGRAWSSPVIWKDQIWLSTATEDGRELSVICVDRETGEIKRDLKLFEVANPQFAHKFNSYASPTPVMEEGRVYVTFGSPGTACIETATGKVLWERLDFVCNHFRGAGSSPIIYEDLLIMNFDGSDFQFVVALDKNTGKTVWRTDRSIDFKDLGPDGKPEAEGDFRKAFATPHVAAFDGQPLLISVGAKACYGYDPATGKELWRTEERSSHSASIRPVVGHGFIYICTGWSRGQLWAIRPGGQGDVTDSHVEWKVQRSVSKKPSPLLVGDLLYMIEDGGIASCIDPKTGEIYWQERVGGNYSASPIYGAGRIYFFSEEGKGTVIKPGREYEVLAVNQLEDGFMASPAVAGQELYLRSKSHLYRVEETR